MNIGITGSRGFIGGHIKEILKIDKRLKLFFCDLPEGNLLESVSLKNFVKNKQVIIHAAAVNRGTDIEVIAGTVVATYNLLAAMREVKSRTKLIFLSSTQAETDSVYGLSKRLAEAMLMNFSRENKSAVSVFRLPNVFGEGCRPFYNSVVATFCYQAAKNQRFTIKNGGRKIKFVYIQDAVKIIADEIFKKRKKLFFFKKIVFQNELSVSELVKLIKSFKNLNDPRKLKSKFCQNLFRVYSSYLL